MTQLLCPPAGWTWLAFVPVITNMCGGSIDEVLAEDLKRGGKYAEHSALTFNGLVWYADGRWHERVAVRGKPVGSYSADTLHQLQKIVNDNHGWT